jgi:hypothetical protein
MPIDLSPIQLGVVIALTKDTGLRGHSLHLCHTVFSSNQLRVKFPFGQQRKSASTTGMSVLGLEAAAETPY